MFRSSTSWQVSSPSYVGSMIIAAPFGGEAQFANRARPSSASCALPPDKLKVSAKLSLAVFRWTFAFHPPRDFPIACGPFFGCAGTVWMDLDGCAVQAKSINRYADHVMVLKRIKQTLKKPCVGPTTHSGVNPYANCRNMAAKKMVLIPVRLETRTLPPTRQIELDQHLLI